jgi:hypothetical protein
MEEVLCTMELLIFHLVNCLDGPVNRGSQADKNHQRTSRDAGREEKVCQGN